MNTQIMQSWRELLSLTGLLLLGACIDLSSSEPAPCGGGAACSAPKSCYEGRCVASCYSDSECEDLERCELGLCVPVALMSDVEAGAEAGIGAGTNAGAEAGASAGAEAGTNAGAESGTNAGGEAGASAGAEAGSSAAGSDAGGELAGSEAGMS